MGNANTHEGRKSGLPDTGLSIKDIRSPPALTIGEKPKVPRFYIVVYSKGC